MICSEELLKKHVILKFKKVNNVYIYNKQRFPNIVLTSQKALVKYLFSMLNEIGKKIFLTSFPTHLNNITDILFVDNLYNYVSLQLFLTELL